MLPRGGREGAKREGGLSGGDLTDMALRGRVVPDQCRIFGPFRDKCRWSLWSGMPPNGRGGGRQSGSQYLHHIGVKL